MSTTPGQRTTRTVDSLRARAIRFADAAAPTLVALWLAGVLLLSMRVGGGWLRVQQMSRTGAHEASHDTRERLHHLAARLGVTTPIRLIEIGHGPRSVGHWLVAADPPDAARARGGLSPRELELLLAHELAHIRRNDYLINLLQTVVETVLFYHPAVWWVSARIREEREHCCDDIAANVGEDRVAYARALLRLEEVRQSVPQLAVAATGGSLLRRVRRLLSPEAPRSDSRTRWAALPLGLAALLGVASGPLHVLAFANDWPSPVSVGQVADTVRVDNRNAAPDTVIRLDDAALPFSQRWIQGERRGRTRDAYWIGYVIAGDARNGWTYIDRRVPVYSNGGMMLGSMQFKDSPRSMTFLGVRLDSLVPPGYAPDDQVILLSFSRAGGRWELDRVHASSFAFPAHFGGRSLVWLGRANDAESITAVRQVFEATSVKDNRNDLIGIVAMHRDENMVLRTFQQWLALDQSYDTRMRVAEALGTLSVDGAVALAARLSRADRSRDVRRAAAEALGEMQLASATDTLITLVRSLDDAEVRRAAVEALGQREEPRAHEALVQVAWNERDTDLAVDAVEAIGETHAPSALSELTRIAREHPTTDVRRKAVESLGELDVPASVLPILVALANEDPSEDLRHEAVEALGELKSASAAGALKSLARSNTHSDVRRAAIEALAEQGDKAEAFDLMASFATSAPSAEDQKQAVEQLGEMEDPRALETLEKLATTHPSHAVRKQAIESLGSAKDRRGALAVLTKVIWSDIDVELQKSALDALSDLHEQVLTAEYGRIAEKHSRTDIRKAAVEALGEREQDDAALSILARLSRTSSDDEVRRAALEAYTNAAPVNATLALLTEVLNSSPVTDFHNQALDLLSEMKGGEGIPALIGVAKNHPDRDLRRRAIDLLGDSDDPRAHAELSRLLERKLERPM
ncbi:MAG: HEAT repeat domain-containing protein [Gemmatimonadaceae bacterium]